MNRTPSSNPGRSAATDACGVHESVAKDSGAKDSGHAQPRTIAAARASIAAGRSDPSALLEIARERAERFAFLNPLAHVDWERARSEARALDERFAQCRSRGAPLPPLAGIPVTIKDLFSVAGMPHTAGTRARLPAFATAESTLVTRLREAGALVFAKSQMHEIALGATGENAWTGDVCNPVDPAHQAGGSSSGAGVCVATGIGLGAVGSDTGGSVRVPAAFCGVVGFKPTYGAIPLDHALYLSWTCDHAGPLANTVVDCAAMFEVMAARSVRHGRVARRPRLGVPAAWLQGRLHPGVRQAFERRLAELAQQGAEIVALALPQLPRAWDCYTPIVRAEAAWVHRDALDAGGQGFSAGVLAPLRAGATIGAREYLDALATRADVAADLQAALAGVDALLLPTTAIPAPRRGTERVEVEGGETSVREAVLGQTLPFSLCGLPSLTLPSDLVDGMPTGLSLVGRRDSDAGVLALGRWLEERLKWEGPPLAAAA